MRPPFALALLLLAACPSSGVRRPADKNVNLTGTVYLGGAERRGDPLEGATITVTRAGDGSQLASATSSVTGGWRLSFAAEPDTRVVVAFAAPSQAPNFRALAVGPYTEAQVSVALEPPEPLDCAESQCVGASDDFGLSNVPERMIGRARTFEPTTQAPRLAGLGALRPVVVAWYQLDAGPAFDAGTLDPDAGLSSPDAGPLGAPLMRARVPFAAWPRLDDAVPATSELELPLWLLDEARGSWSRQGEARLQTEYGLKIPQSALARLRAGQWSGGVVAAAPVTRSGYWAIGAPAPDAGCVTGKVEADGQSAQGVLLALEGGEPAASGADGTFCLATAVGSGGPLAVQLAGLGYAGPAVSAPTASGTCGGSCASVEKVSVTAEALKTAKLCRLSGQTVDAAGAPVTGAVVLGLDETVGGTAFTTLCGKLGSRCALSTSSDEKGEFTLELPLLSELSLAATALVEKKPGLIEASRRGFLLVRECPAAPLKLRLTAGHDKLEVALTLSGGSIAWAPAKPAVVVRAVTAQGTVKWELEAAGGLAPPLTYGVVPAGAAQRVPAAGAPAALATGDELSVVLDGTGPDGYQYSGAAAAAVP